MKVQALAGGAVIIDKAAVITGRVVKGRQFGRILGFPTVNLDRRQYAAKKMRVQLGVWAGTAQLPSGKIKKAGIVIGPVDTRGLPKIEAHLLNFSGNLYGKKVTLRLHKYLRPFRKYAGIDKLKSQIAEDLLKIKKLKSLN